jgi:hypothetical protein
LYRVDSRLSCWAERNLLRSSWEISTIGTNITQHGKHTKSYWKSPSLMSKSAISMAIFNSELVCLPCWTNQRPNIGRQSGDNLQILRGVWIERAAVTCWRLPGAKCLFHVPTKKCNGVQ